MARKVLGLIVWYDSGEPYRVKTPEDWAALPDDGVVECVVYFDDGRRNSLGGHDWYFYAPHPDGPIYGSQTYTTEKEIKKRYPGANVKRGKWVPEATLHRVAEEAVKARW